MKGEGAGKTWWNKEEETTADKEREELTDYEGKGEWKGKIIKQQEARIKRLKDEKWKRIKMNGREIRKWKELKKKIKCDTKIRLKGKREKRKTEG